MSDVQALNYTAHAIEDVREHANQLPARYSSSATQLHRITELMDQAVKFLLPAHGDLIDFTRADDATMELLRLPFPLVVLEVPFPPRGNIISEGPMKETSSSRRIVLAWDHTFAAKSGIAPDYKEPGVYVMAIYFTDEERQWMVSPVGLFMPRDNDIRTVADGTTIAAEKLAVEALRQQQAITDKSPVLDVRYYSVLPQFRQLLVQREGEDVADARLQLDVRDEMLFTWGFCLTVNCVNVGMSRLAAPEKLNVKRIRNGKLPLYEYRVLELPEPRVAASPTFRNEGIRQGPRMHLRRGHPRRLPDGNTTYVRATVIGSANQGVLQKDYKVPARPRA